MDQLRRPGTVLVITLLLSTLISCGGSGGGPGGKGGPGGPKAPSGPVPVQTLTVSPLPYTPTVELAGTLAPWDTVNLATEVTGTVDRVLVDLGSTVKKGQVLLEVSPDELGWAADKAKADAELAAATLARVETLTQSNAATAADLDKARADAARTTAESRLAARRRDDARVRAPFDGVISSRKVAVGDYVQPGKVVLTLTATHPLRLQLDVPEAQALATRPGGKLELLLGGGSAPIAAEISRVAPLISASTRTFQVEADIPNPDGQLKAGAFVKARLLSAASQEAYEVPERAIVNQAGENRAFVVVNGQVKARPVTILERRDASSIVQGLSSGDVVAVTNTSRLADGVAVEPAREGEAPASSPAPAGGKP